MFFIIAFGLTFGAGYLAGWEICATHLNLDLAAARSEIRHLEGLVAAYKRLEELR